MKIVTFMMREISYKNKTTHSRESRMGGDQVRSPFQFMERNEMMIINPRNRRKASALAQIQPLLLRVIVSVAMACLTIVRVTMLFLLVLRI
jgi:hypothetical protein